MTASRTARATSAAFVALCASALLSTVLITTSQAPLQSRDAGSSQTVVAAAGTASPAPVTNPSPADVTWGG